MDRPDWIEAMILQAKLGRARRDAQVDCCSAFAAALFDVLQARGIDCRMACVTLGSDVGTPAAHALVAVGDRYYDSMGQFTHEIWRRRARIHPLVKTTAVFSADQRDDSFEPDLAELHTWYLRVLTKAMQATPVTSGSATGIRMSAALR